MLKKMMVYTLLLATLSPSFSKDRKTKEISTFVDSVETCIHLSGEFEPSASKKERENLIKHTNKICGEADRKRRLLKKKYGKEPFVKNILFKYRDFSYD